MLIIRNSRNQVLVSSSPNQIKYKQTTLYLHFGCINYTSISCKSLLHFCLTTYPHCEILILEICFVYHYNSKQEVLGFWWPIIYIFYNCPAVPECIFYHIQFYFVAHWFEYLRPHHFPVHFFSKPSNSSDPKLGCLGFVWPVIFLLWNEITLSPFYPLISHLQATDSTLASVSDKDK